MKSLLEEETGKKVLAILSFLDSVATFLGSILISIYIKDPSRNFENNNLNKIIVEKFFNKHATLGEWIGILREGLTHFQKEEDFFMPELKDFASGIKDPLKITEESIKILKIKEKDRGLLDDLNIFRLGVGHPEKRINYLEKHNLSLHEFSEDMIKDYEKSFPKVIPDLTRLIYGLSFLSDYWLFFIRNIREEEGERLAEIYLYNSDRPSIDELDVTDCIKELLHDEDFEPNIYRTRLFLARVIKDETSLFQTVKAEKIIEVNPVLINWIKERDYLPYRFLEWKDRKKKRIFMGELIYQRGKEEIPHEDTREHLWETYQELKSRLKLTNDDSYEIKEEKCLTMFHSDQRYKIIRKEIYPHLNIADEILPSVKNVQEDIESNLQAEIFTLRQSVENLWNNPEKWNCVLLGDGGMGKTTSLLKLWESFLSGNDISPVPVFLQLEKYNHTGENYKKSFIWDRISLEYLNRVSTPEDIIEMKNYFMERIKSGGKECPSVILLLDGFNEVTEDSRELLLCLMEIRELKGVQIVISSRYDMRKTLNWADFNAFSLIELTDEQIKSFMNLQSTDFDGSLIKNIPLLRSPMMLTLYCGLEREMKICSGKDDYDFIPSPGYKAEILHNFIVSSISREDRQIVAPSDRIIHRLYLRFLLPRIGYEMEKAGLFEITHEKLVNIIKEELKRYSSDEFLNLYPAIDSQMNDETESLLNSDNRKNIREVMRRLKENYCMMRELDGHSYILFHQDFRDYFASVYIKQKLEERVTLCDSTLPELSCRVFDTHLTNMVGELTGEPARSPSIRGCYRKDIINGTLLDRILALLRNKEIGEGDYRILNILNILKEKRCDLSDTDLSSLDLRHIVLNSVRLGYRETGNILRSADFKNSILRGCNFFQQGHSRWVTTVCYSHDGKKILSGSEDSTVKEWDVLSGECIRTYKGHSSTVSSLSYSHDGKRILSGSEDGTVKEWDVLSGECIRTYKGHSRYVESVNYSFDGKKIVSAGRDGTVREWDRETGDCIGSYNFSGVTCVSYSPDNRRILAGGYDGTVREWDVNTGECINTYKGHNKYITSIYCSSDGSHFISGSEDRTIMEWNINSGTVRTYKGHSDMVSSVRYNRDNSRIISGSYDKTIMEWDVNTGKCIKIYIGHSESVSSVSYSPDGKRIVSGSVDTAIKEWDTGTGECIKTYRGSSIKATSAVYSPDGNRILTGSEDKTMREWDVTSGRCIRIYTGHTDFVSAAIYSPDGKKILSASHDKTIREWDVNTGECLFIYKGHSDIITSILYSPDGRRIFSGSYDKTVREWDVNTGKCSRIYKGHTWYVTSLTMKPEGKSIVSGSSDMTLKEWDISTGECIRTFRGHNTKISSVSYSMDGKRIVSGSSDMTLKEWDTLTGECVKTYNGDSTKISSVSCSPDGKKIISACWDKIKEWDTERGECIRIFKGHYMRISSVTYSPDGKTILSSGYDGTIREWDVNTGECMRVFKNLAGLFVQGVNMSEVHSFSQINEEEKKILEDYGANF